jgi:hypothetical protein
VGPYLRGDIILSHNKHLNIGDYLIDDHTKNGVHRFTGEHLHFGTIYFGLPKDYFLCILIRPKSKGVHKHAFMSLSFNPELTQVLQVLKQEKLPKAS